MIENRTSEQWGRFAPTGRAKWAINQSNRHPQSLWGSACRRMVLTGRTQPVDVTRFGARFRLYPLDNLCEKRALLRAKQFDRQERELLLERLHDGFRFVDIGANIGLYSLFVAANAGPDCNVLAIEPQPVIKGRLRFNLAANPTLHIDHLDCALADKKGLMRMGISTRNRGASGFALRSGREPDSETLVQTQILLDVLRTHQMAGADALKIDIEGAEDQVLPGFFASAENEELPSMLLLERNENWAVDCIELATKRGYRQIAETSMNVVLER